MTNDGGSSWLFQLRCAWTSRLRSCAGLRGRRRMARRLGGFWLLQRSMTVRRAPRRRGSVASDFRSSGNNTICQRGPQKASALQSLVPQLRMQTLRVYRCSLYGSRIRSTHCSDDDSLASASVTIGTASASCCRWTTAPYGRFLHNGPILRAWIQRLSWVMGRRLCVLSI